MLNTLVHIVPVDKGLQSVLYNATHGNGDAHPMLESGPFMNSRSSTVA